MNYPHNCPLSEDRLETFKKFRAKANTQNFSDHYLCRWLSSRAWNYDLTVEAWDKFIDWRIK